MSMHLYRGIVRMDIWSDGLSTGPDYPNTITPQSIGTNSATRYPLHVPTTWNPAWTQPNIYHIYIYVYCPGTSDDIMISVSTLLLNQNPTYFRVSYLTQALSLSVVAFQCLPFLDWFESLFPTWFDQYFLTWFNTWFLTGCESVFSDSIQLMFNTFIFGWSQIIWAPTHSVFRESHIDQGCLPDLPALKSWNISLF